MSKPETRAAGTADATLTVAGLGALTVRPLDAPDQPAVRALFARVAHELSATAIHSIPALASGDAERGRGASWGLFGPAATGSRLLAIGGLRLEDGDDSASFAVAVAPPFRGLGLGTAMVRTLLAETERQGSSSLKARISTSNCAMIALARRVGLERQRLFGDEPILLHARTAADRAPRNHPIVKPQASAPAPLSQLLAGTDATTA